jgi:hypothetical protein
MQRCVYVNFHYTSIKTHHIKHGFRKLSILTLFIFTITVSLLYDKWILRIPM